MASPSTGVAPAPIDMTGRGGAALLWKILETGGVRAIFLIRTVVLARLLVPEDFGLFAVSLVAVDLLRRVTNVGVIPALVQRVEVDRRHYDVAWTVNVTRSLGISLLVLLAAPVAAELLGEPRAEDLIRVAALLPTLEASASIGIAELTRTLRFRPMALLKLAESGIVTAVSVALAGSFGPWALMFGLIAGTVASVVASYVLAPYRPRLSFDLTAFRPLVRYGRWVFLTGIASAIGGGLLQAVLARRLGVAELGLYFLAAKLAFIPAELAAQAVSPVAFPLYARVQSDPARVAKVFHSMLLGMAMLFLPLCAQLIVLTPSLVADLLGPRWEGAVRLIQLLLLVNVVGLFGETVGPVLRGIGRPHQSLAIELIQSVLLIGLCWTLAERFGAVSAAIAWLAAVSVAQLPSYILLQRICPRPFAGLGRPITLIATASVLGGVVAARIDDLVVGVTGLLLAAASGAASTALLLLLLDRRFEGSIQPLLRKAFPQIAASIHLRTTNC